MFAGDALSLLDQLRGRVDAELAARLDAVVASGGCPARLGDALRYTLLAPGKRLRPLLVALGHAAAGGDGVAPWPAACAVEMVHTYSLVHDDLPAMDDDDLRRGRPTCHRQFDEATAILAGDALLTLAFETLAGGYPPRVAAVCTLELARAAGAAGMVGGQTADLGAEGRPGYGDAPQTLEQVESVHARKTGALFRAALRMGAWAAHGDRPGTPDALAPLDRFGTAFGLAFQITDDLLDVESSADRAGKRTQKDAARGKLTYPELLGVADSRFRAASLAEEAQECLRPFGKPGEPLAALARSLLGRDR